MIDSIRDRVYKLYNNDYSLTLEEYNKLIKDCVYNYEMAAVVFIYDNMKYHNIEPDDITYSTINQLHSKTVKECNYIYIKNQNVGKLEPRRRIHKIIKGYNYSENYTNALKYKDTVVDYINKNPLIVDYPRIKLANELSKKCSISFNDARYIITNLKRTKSLKSSQKTIDDFSTISEIHNKAPQTKATQTSLNQFFSVIT